MIEGCPDDDNMRVTHMSFEEEFRKELFLYMNMNFKTASNDDVNFIRCLYQRKMTQVKIYPVSKANVTFVVSRMKKGEGKYLAFY